MLLKKSRIRSMSEVPLLVVEVVVADVDELVRVVVVDVTVVVVVVVVVVG
jgi:hypothetical protein